MNVQRIVLIGGPFDGHVHQVNPDAGHHLRLTCNGGFVQYDLQVLGKSSSGQDLWYAVFHGFEESVLEWLLRHYETKARVL